MTAMSETKKAALSGKYAAYPEYKDLGVEWLGDIPTHWSAKPIKFLCTYNDEVINDSTDNNYEIEYVDIGSVSASTGITKTETICFSKAPSRARRIVKDGDVIISTVRTYLEAIAPINNPPSNMVVSTGFAVIRPTSELHKDFAAYCLRAKGFIKEVVARSVGVSYPAINASDLVNISIPFVSIDEQTQIATFLDHETVKIDTLIEKQQQLIGLLKEKRQAVISHAVTKGLNPQAPMKDSGVEWLGDVPEHWGVLRLSRVGKVGQGCSFSHSIQGQTKGDIPWYKVMDMNTDGNEEYMNKSSNYINKKLASRIGAPIFPKGSIIFPRVGAALLTNKRRILSVDSIVDDNIYTFVSRKVKHRFAYRLLQLINMETLCSPGLVPTITFSAINNIYIPLPSLAEQDNIIEYIDHKLSHIDLLIDKTNNAIKLSQERRTALISAAVTGKIDVRHFTLKDGIAPTTSIDTNEAAQEAMA